MIPNQWYAVLDAKELKNRPVGATRFGEKLVFWRDEEGICCISDVCCHRGASLALGEIADHRLACPFHGLRYDASGRVVLIPANGKTSPVPSNFRVRAYAAREAYGFIWVWYGEKDDAPEEIPFFEELADWAYGGFSEVWGVHYTRAVENQLDVVHLPFVHRTTIGRGGKTLVNGPVAVWNGTRMTFYVDNEADRGQKPLKAAEIEHPERLFSLQLQMPNLWQNRVSDRLRIVAAFAPVDGEHTRIYLRMYQNLARFPVGKQLFALLGNAMNRVILHQDRRVVLTQLPKKSELKMGENLFPGDLPILEFRKKRQELRDGK